MKIYKYLLAAAAMVALASCTQDFLDEQGRNPQTEGSRTIAVSFGTSVKSELDRDGVTPKFVNGDRITVSNGKQCEEKDITVKDGIASFSTDLTGPLKAVYPYDAAEISGGDIVGVTVSENQSGSFREANIAMAEIGASENTAIFKNKTAVLKFYVGSGIGVTELEITEIDGRRIAGNSSESAQEVPGGASVVPGGMDVVNESTGVFPGDENPPIASGTIITVAPTSETGSTFEDCYEDRFCYVAILPTSGETTYRLGVASYTKTQSPTKAAHGSNVVKKAYADVSLPAGTLASVFIPYYITINVGTEDNPYLQHWSYCNIGAFLPEEQGSTFSWGNTVSCGEFSQENYPHQGDGYSLNEDITLYDGQYDAASAAWSNSSGHMVISEGWRMPTKAEIDTLLNRFQTEPGRKFASEKYSNTAGVFFTDSRNSQVFFAINNYWTATYSSTEKAYVFEMEDSNNSLRTTEDERWKGHPIRPIYGAPLDESTGISIADICESDEIL